MPRWYWLRRGRNAHRDSCWIGESHSIGKPCAGTYRSGAQFGHRRCRSGHDYGVGQRFRSGVDRRMERRRLEYGVRIRYFIDCSDSFSGLNDGGHRESYGQQSIAGGRCIRRGGLYDRESGGDNPLYLPSFRHGRKQ